MSESYANWTRHVASLAEALATIGPEAKRLGLEGPEGQNWHALFTQKLLPQLELPPLLVVAVVGGTNLGKSVIFNHLAGEHASGVSPLAAGTRHPVLLVPESFADPQALRHLFPQFELHPWQSSDDSLREAHEHRLFWRVGRNLPPRLLILDAPDIDSDAQVNWHRADCLRQAADVLVAVLTQQKYNDAAVKRFFREAAQADKPMVVVFNQCDLVEDREYWPQWLRTFTSETGADAELVYVCPRDRAAAAQLRLPFHRMDRQGQSLNRPPSSLREDLASLEFDAIKIRTFRGALACVVSPRTGAPAYFDKLRAAAAEFGGAAASLSATELARVHWPALPARFLVTEIGQWWDQRRSEWSRRVHGFYRRVGQGLTWPVRKAWQSLHPPEPEDDIAFAALEREAVILAVEQLINELERLQQMGNEKLRPRLQGLLGGASRQSLLERVREAHAQLEPIDDDYRRYLQDALDQWSQKNPAVISWLRSLDHALALARPALTIVLAVGGGALAGGIVHEASAQVAAHTVGQMATEVAITGGVTAGGEALVGATGEGIRQAAGTLFRRLQERYARQRAEWLARWLERELLGGLLEELRRGAELPQSPPFRQAEAALAALAQQS